MPADPPEHSLATLAVTAGRPHAVPDAPLNPPITLASTYVAGGDMEYGRYGNPTWAALEEALGALEGGRCLTFASGLAAVATVLDLVGRGNRVVAPHNSYLGVTLQLADLESRGRLEARLVDITDTAAVAAACAEAALVWIESPTNPMLDVADLPAIAAAAHAAGARVVVDNTFATPLLQRPLELGADLVVHSATKFLSGHSDVVLGAIVSRDEEVYAALKGRRDLIGAIPGTVEAWLALRGLRTLALRMERAQATARLLVERLRSHPSVAEVRYPGFGAIVSLVLDSARSADLLTGSTALWVPATSLGGVESTFERRRRWATESPSVPEGLVRLSVGIEDPQDLWSDLDRALAHLPHPRNGA